MLPLTKKELKSHEDSKVYQICRIRFLKKLSKYINYREVRDHSHYTGKYRGEPHSICNLKFNVLNDISEVFHRGSDYDYHFIIKELANEFEGQFECIGENKVKCKTFSVPLKKEILKTDKDGNEIVDTISYKIKFIDSVRFMASSLPNLIDNLTERIHKIKCKGWDCFLEYKRVKGNLIIYKCLSCNKCYSKKLNE